MSTKTRFYPLGEKGLSVVSKNEQTALHNLDFDRWMRLAEESPESFEAARVAAIEALIATFPPENQERMRRLQWRIDQERRLAKSPMGSCLRLSKMMWRQFLGDGGLRERLLDLAGSLRGESLEASQGQRRIVNNAQVLAFSRSTE